MIARLHELLVDAVEQLRAGRFDQPVTVAEVYQDLVPYRGVRDALRLELNADYEHALLRLLSGEGDCVRLEPEEARRELQEELGSPNPFVGLYRKFAGCDVWIRPARSSPDAPAAPEPAPAAGEPFDYEFLDALRAETPAPEPLPAAEAAAALPDPQEPRAAAPALAPHPQLDPAAARAEAAPAAAAVVARAAGCAFCDAPLPQGRAVRFCPFCGEDQRRRPCPECGETLEPGWRFCIDCGAGVAGEEEPSGAA